MFADDTTFITFGKDLEILNQENEIVISKASEWFGANSMLLNKDKTVSLLFTLNESQELATISRTDKSFRHLY